MDDLSAREVLLVRVIDRAEPAFPGWTAADRAWAARVAAEQVGPGAAPDAFVAARAHAALQRLLPRERPATRAVWGWLRRPLWRPAWAWLGVATGLIVGVVLDTVGSGGYINLLSLAAFGVLGWNAVAYAVLLVRALLRLARRPVAPGPIARALGHLGERAGDRVRPRVLAAAGIAGVWPAYLAEWSAASGRLAAAALAATLHAAAAGVALGGLASLYLRGLVFDYRAGWQSTFLGPEVVHDLFATVLGPAAALTGLPLPDVAGVAALRLGAGATGTPAAPWIHLYAVTVGLAVVLPRAGLLLGSLATLRRLSARFPLALDTPYFQQLLRQNRPRPACVRAWPHAAAPSAAAALGVRAACARVFGAAVTVELEPAVAFGDEDAVAPDPRAGTEVALALFDLAATPEAEQQGRLLQALATRLPPGVPVVVVVDEAGFRARFGLLPERLAQRRAAWTAFAGRYGTVAVFADLAHPDLDAVAAGLQAALDRPVRQVAA